MEESVTVLVLQGTPEDIYAVLKKLKLKPRTKLPIPPATPTEPTPLDVELIISRLPKGRKLFTSVEVTHAFTGIEYGSIISEDVRRCSNVVRTRDDAPVQRIPERMFIRGRGGVHSLYALREDWARFAADKVAVQNEIDRVYRDPSVPRFNLG